MICSFITKTLKNIKIDGWLHMHSQQMLKLYMPILTLFLLCWKPDPNFVSGMNCIKDKIVTIATLFIGINWMLVILCREKLIYFLMHIYKNFTKVYTCICTWPLRNSMGERNDSKIVYKLNSENTFLTFKTKLFLYYFLYLRINITNSFSKQLEAFPPYYFYI